MSIAWFYILLCIKGSHLGRDIAQQRGAQRANRGGANRRRDVVVCGGDVRRQGAERVEGSLAATYRDSGREYAKWKRKI